MTQSTKPGSTARLCLIVNPISGTVSKLRMIPLIARRLEAAGIDLEIKPTEGPGHATELAAGAARCGRFDGVLACGGDGTVNEAARGLVGTGTPLGIIPAGSGNGLARHLGIPVDVDRSLKVIAERNIIKADYGLANTTPFFCTCGVGFDAAVSERFARQKRRGIMMYLKSTIDEYLKFNPEEYIIEAGGQVLTERAFLVVCCNASQYGNNAFIAPDASVTDGLLDLAIVHAGNPLTHARVGLDLLTGFIGKNALADIIRVKSASIHRKRPGAAHIDGDPHTMPKDIDINCVPGALKIFAPTSNTRFRPLLTPMSLFFRDCGLSISRLWRNN